MIQSLSLPEFSGWIIVNPGELYTIDEFPLPMSYTKVLGWGNDWDCQGLAGSEYWYTWGALPREWMATAG